MSSIVVSRSLASRHNVAARMAVLAATALDTAEQDRVAGRFSRGDDVLSFESARNGAAHEHTRRPARRRWPHARGERLRGGGGDDPALRTTPRRVGIPGTVEHLKAWIDWGGGTICAPAELGVITY